MEANVPEFVAMKLDINSFKEFVPLKNVQLSSLKVESGDFKPTKNNNLKN